MPLDGICLCAGLVYVLERPLEVLLHCRHAENEHLPYSLPEMRVHEYRIISQGAAFREGEAVSLRHLRQRMGTSTLGYMFFPAVQPLFQGLKAACDRGHFLVNLKQLSG